MPRKIISLSESHIDSVIRIEDDSFLEPWKFTDFVNVLGLNSGDNIAVVIDDELVGYTFAEIEHDRIYISNMAVAEVHRRNGIASMMLDYYKIRLTQLNKDILYATVRESDLRLQMFFKKNGFLYVESLRDLCETVKEDTYVFEYVKRMRI